LRDGFAKLIGREIDFAADEKVIISQADACRHHQLGFGSGG
jgi:hypothetical protein